MATPFLLTKQVRDFSFGTIEKMSDDDIHALLVQMRWGTDGTQVCPECGVVAQHYWKRTRKQWQCREISCRRTFSVLSGTKLEDCKLPLRKVLQILFTYVANSKGISAIQMSRLHGVTHTTAYVLMQKIREALMVTWDCTPLIGKVHIDGAHVAGRLRKGRDKKTVNMPKEPEKKRGGSRTYHPNRRIAMVAAGVIDGKGSQRVITVVVPAETEEFVLPWVEQSVMSGATVHTDEGGAYALLGADYDHHSVNHSVEFQSDSFVNNNQAESFFSRVRRFYIGTVHRMTPKYIADYLTEMAFREQFKRKGNKAQLEEVLKALLTSGTSVFWKRYQQGHHRKDEIVFPMTVEDAVKGTRQAGFDLMAKQQAEKLLDRAKRSDASEAEPVKAGGGHSKPARTEKPEKSKSERSLSSGARPRKTSSKDRNG